MRGKRAGTPPRRAAASCASASPDLHLILSLKAAYLEEVTLGRTRLGYSGQPLLKGMLLWTAHCREDKAYAHDLFAGLSEPGKFGILTIQDSRNTAGQIGIDGCDRFVNGGVIFGTGRNGRRASQAGTNSLGRPEEALAQIPQDRDFGQAYREDVGARFQHFTCAHPV